MESKTLIGIGIGIGLAISGIVNFAIMGCAKIKRDKELEMISSYSGVPLKKVKEIFEGKHTVANLGSIIKSLASETAD